ncbi:hypothetical protein Tcan_01243, partial [Toxocara canis]
WRLWQCEYLHLLRERTQQFHRGPYAQTRRVPRVGEAVLLHDSAPTGTWKLTRIVAVRTGIDNVIRIARIQTSISCLLARTTAQLYLSKVDDDVVEFNKHSK